MTKEQKEFIKMQPPIFLEEASKGTYICPQCKSGSGESHTGIQENPKKPGQWHCWSCGFTGDIIDLVKAAYKIYSFKDAFDKAAEMYGVTNDSEEWAATHHDPESDLPGNTGFYQLPEQKREYKPVAPREKVDYSDYFWQHRVRNDEDFKYLEDRGISPQTQLEWGVGYDPAWKSPAAIKNRIERGGSADDIPATPRCIIPRGPHSYLARRTDGNDAMKKMAEGSTEILHIDALSEAEVVFVTEGEIDAMSIADVERYIYNHKKLDEIALCSCSMINRFLTEIDERIAAGTLTAKHIITAFDTDKAGQEATERLKTALASRGIHTEELMIYDPEAKDVNEWLIRDREGLKEMVESHIRAYEQGRNPDDVYREMFKTSEPSREEETEHEIEEPELFEQFY
jgi:replicative DNA helicase